MCCFKFKFKLKLPTDKQTKVMKLTRSAIVAILTLKSLIYQRIEGVVVVGC